MENMYKTADSRVYRMWNQMNQNCYNPKNYYYGIRGALGIKVCDEWNEYKPFCDWALTNGYDEKLTLERIDKTKDYSSDNCRWSTTMEQNNNHRRNRLLTYQDKTQTITNWARELGLSSHTVLAQRIDAKLPKHLVFFPGRLVSDVTGKTNIEKLKSIWSRIKQRCLNPRNTQYKNYGAKGIKVCDSWLDYCNFKLWAESNGFNEKLALIRKDFNKDYCPENCFWADGKLSTKNNVRSSLYTYEGETHTISDWARKLNISPEAFAKRMCYHNMPEDKKFKLGNMIHDTRPSNCNGKYSKLLTRGII